MTEWWLIGILAIAPTIAIVFYIMDYFDKHETGE